MEEKDKKVYYLLGLSVVFALISFGLSIYFSLSALYGEMVGHGLIMIVAWIPCAGLIILQVLVYIYGLYCMRTNVNEMKKMSKSTWIFGILTGAYMMVISLIFACTNITQLGYYFIVVAINGANLAFLIFWTKKCKKRNLG
mgnify:CR=1 FL=1